MVIKVKPRYSFGVIVMGWLQTLGLILFVLAVLVGAVYLVDALIWLLR